MKSCTFFGHSDCCEPIKLLLKNTLINLIKDNVTTFYVGNNGLYDSNVISVLRELKESYAQISFFVVLAYLPKVKEDIKLYETIYPLGIEVVPPRFAISFRNKWMLQKSDYVVTYIKRPQGGAAQFHELALEKYKKVINLPDIMSDD